MTFDEVLAQVVDLLQREGRVSYRALKRRFALDDDYLEDLKAEIMQAKRLALDEDGVVLVWVGAAPPASAVGREAVTPSAPPGDPTVLLEPPGPSPDRPEAERRQLTVLVCDLVDSTALAGRLDPEEWRDVVRAYQASCTQVIQRFEGHTAQYLGDGLLVYFGYPRAHEDDAQRAVRTELAIMDALRQLNTGLTREAGIHLGVRVGIHTGLVVGEMGGEGRQEQLALGEVPNIAAGTQGLAAPDTVVISAAAHRLVQGYFVCRSLGPHPLKGMARPVEVYRVVGESEAQSRLEIVSARGPTPLVGRSSEVALLLQRWAQVKEGIGQVVLLSGEAGIGKSHLVQAVKALVAGEPHVRWECRCSPYYQHSALYPFIDLLQRAFQFQRDESPAAKLGKLEAALAHDHVPLPDEVRETYLEVRETGTDYVLTALEILSPTNKRPGRGRRIYEDKRMEVLASRTHLVEVDLIRTGEPMPILGNGSASDYRILVSRGDCRPHATLYAFGVRQPIPPFSLPLKLDDQEPTVDLGRILHDLYDRASYDLRLDYAGDPNPPLPSAEAAWADQLLRQTGLR